MAGGAGSEGSAGWWSMYWMVQEAFGGMVRIQCQWGDTTGYLTRDTIPGAPPRQAGTTVSLHSLEENWDSQLWMIKPVGGGGENDGYYYLINQWEGSGYLTSDWTNGPGSSQILKLDSKKTNNQNGQRWQFSIVS